MTSKELIKTFQAFQAGLERNTYLLNAIRMMSAHQITITGLHARALTVTAGASDTHHAVEITRKAMKEVISEVKKLRPRQVFTEIHAVIASVSQLEPTVDSTTSKRLENLRQEFESFAEAYEAFISNQFLGEMASLLSVAQRLDAAILCYNQVASIVLNNLCPERESISDSKGTLEVYLTSQLDFPLFIKKAAALQKIYEELCALLRISSTLEPLQIIKLESGSFWAWLSGNVAVLGAMSSVIQKGASFLYRNYTDEGKLSTIPKKAETVESVLRLVDELKKRNVPTEDLESHLQKASVLIGKDLESLLAGEPALQLNGELIALSPGSQQNLIAVKEVKLLEQQNPE